MKNQEFEQSSARYLLANHQHEGTGTTLERSNCAACVLNGYGDEKLAREEKLPVQPNFAGWARVYVEAGKLIPKKYVAAFLAELESDNEGYANALKLDIIRYGLVIE